MENKNIKIILASVYSSIVSIVFVALITIWADLSAPLKAWLKSLSGHHWVSKSIMMLVFYFLFLAIFFTLIKNAEIGRLKRSLLVLNIVILLGTAAVIGFYVWHFLWA